MDVFEEFEQLLGEFGAFLWRELTPQIAATIGASAVTLIIGLIVLHKNSSKEYVSRSVKKAQAMGHVLTGRRVSAWVMTDDRLDVNAKTNAIFEYEYGGKTYRYHFFERRKPPETIQLYYLNNPTHVFIQKNRGYLRGLVVLMLTFLAGAVTAFLMR